MEQDYHPGDSRTVKKLGDREKATLISERGLYLCRQLPTLPHTFACSTIGPAGLNFRVRDGNGWNPRGKITDKSEPSAFRNFVLCGLSRLMRGKLGDRYPPAKRCASGRSPSLHLEGQWQCLSG